MKLTPDLEFSCQHNSVFLPDHLQKAFYFITWMWPRLCKISIRSTLLAQTESQLLSECQTVVLLSLQQPPVKQDIKSHQGSWNEKCCFDNWNSKHANKSLVFTKHIFVFELKFWEHLLRGENYQHICNMIVPVGIFYRSHSTCQKTGHHATDN